MYFDFRIVSIDNETEIIDRTQVTYLDELNPSEMVDYNELDCQLFEMERMERKRRIEQERKRNSNNLFCKIASACGIL